MKNRITSKLIFAVGCVAIVVILIFAYFIIHAQKKALISQVEHNANQLSETVKSSTKYDMLLNQRDRIHRIIDSIGQQEGIEKVRIFNKEGEIIYSSDKKEINTMVDKRAEACYVCHSSGQPLKGVSIRARTRFFSNQGKNETLGIINPINNEPGCWQADCHAHLENQKVLGVLDVTMSLDEVTREIRANQMKMVLFAVSAIVAISVILWFFVQKFVGKPVHRLAEATNIVSSGNLDYKIKVSGKDELSHLAKSFNEMTRKLYEAQRKVYQSEKLASLGRLAAGVAHEINNPLTGVLTYSSFLLKRCADNPDHKKDLEVIVRETKRCREIVKGLLDFARQEAPKKSNVSINDVVNQTVSILDNQFNLQNISIQINLTGNLPVIWADANQLQQVLINLLVNAADAIGSKGGKIHIVTRADKLNEKDAVLIEVTDSGKGISEENLTKIFEPFYSTKGQKGTGLGLAIAWGIIGKHNGKIDVISEVGKGTTFTLRLPANQESVRLIAEEKHELAV